MLILLGRLRRSRGLINENHKYTQRKLAYMTAEFHFRLLDMTCMLCERNNNSKYIYYSSIEYIFMSKTTMIEVWKDFV